MTSGSLARLWSQSRLAKAAIIAATVTVLAVVTSFLPLGELVRAQVWTLGFLAAMITVGLAGAVRLGQRQVRPSLLPTTRLGWWALGLFALAVVIVLVMVAIVVGISQGAGEPRTPMFVYSTGVLVALLAAGLCGAVAWFAREERSFVVLLTLLPALFGLYFLGGELLFPH